MGELADLLDAMTIKAKSPDGLIGAVLKDRRRVEFDIEEDAYYDYDVANLEWQLGQLLSGLWNGVRVGQAQAYTKVTGKEPKTDAEHWDARRRRFRAEREQLVAIGISARGYLSVHATGLREWLVEVDDEIFERLDEPEFLSECSTAIAELLANHAGKLNDLKEKHYGTQERRAGHGPARRR